MKVLKNGQVFLQGELRNLDVQFDRKIREIGKDLEGREIDCSGKIILPGAIDSHVHFRDFNQSHKETWETGSRAAVKGGVTTVVEMPNNDPPIVTEERLRKKKRLANEDSVVNYGLYFGVGKNLEMVDKISGDIQGYKIFMAKSTGSLKMTNRGRLAKAFKKLGKTKEVLGVHPEDQEVNSSFGKVEKPLDHAKSRPRISEALAVATAVELASRYGVKLHCLHVTNKYSLKVLEEAKERGVDVTVETCPHYLYFTEEMLSEKGNLAKMNPPLRKEEDRKALLEALRSGLINTVASDHAPHTLEEKSKEVSEAPSGVPGTEMLVPLVLNLVNEREISLKRAVELISKNPAQRFGFKNKGTIEKGKEANFTVVDLDKEKEVKREDIASKCGWSPYEGMELQGWPVMTFVRGKLTWKE